MRIRSYLLVAGALALSAGVALSESHSEKPAKGKVELEGKATATTAAAAAAVGSPETAKWSATTYEAAATEANKKVLKSGKVETITGEVIDVSCYMQLGKRGAAHVDCGTKCIKNGQPIGLLDKDDDIFILFAEEHHPRRDGEADLKSTFLPFLSKTVTVTGMKTEMKGYKALFVQATEAAKQMNAVDTSK